MPSQMMPCHLILSQLKPSSWCSQYMQSPLMQSELMPCQLMQSVNEELVDAERVN